MRPYLVRGSRTYQVLTYKDGHNVADKKQAITSDVLWCEKKDLPTALVNHAQTTGLEIWNVWELAGQPIEIPANCHECQLRCPGCMDRCPVLGRA